MNDFLQQFLIESREFVEQATEGLLHWNVHLLMPSV